MRRIIAICAIFLLSGGCDSEVLRKNQPGYGIILFPITNDSGTVVESVIVNAIACDSPAHVGRIKEGDIVVAVGNISLVRVTKKDYDGVVALLDIAPGRITLTLARKKGIALTSVYSVELDPRPITGRYECGLSGAA